MHLVRDKQDLHEQRLFDVKKHFRATIGANYVDQARWISEAAYLLALAAATESPRLTTPQREELEFAIFAAAEAACAELGRHYSRDQIRHGFRAFAEIVAYWAADGSGRSAMGSAIQDSRDVARMLRNDCHNVSLAADIAERRRSCLAFGGAA